MIDTIPYMLLVIGLDCSGSMQGEGIKQLRAAMESLISQLKSLKDADHVLVSVVLFNDEIIQATTPTLVNQFSMPELKADGYTDVGLALNKMMEIADDWKNEFASDSNRKRFSPNLILASDCVSFIGDNAERDIVTEYTRIAEKARLAAVKRHYHFVPVACGEANRNLLQMLRDDHRIIDAGNYEGLKLAFEKIGKSSKQISEGKSESSSGDIMETISDKIEPETDPDIIGSALDDYDDLDDILSNY